MKRIAFFGGTFDPPHRGHLAIARAAADQFALDTVLFAPAASQPFKMNQAISPFIHRYAMTVLASQVDLRFVPSLLDAPRDDVSARDSAQQRPNYTVDTLQRLLRSLQDANEPAHLFTLVGADSWAQIAHWHAAPQLLALTDWIVAARPGFPLTGAIRHLPAEVASEPLPDNSAHPGLILHHTKGITTRAFFLSQVHEDISATELRSGLDAQNIDPLSVTPAVRDYILKADLYRTMPQSLP